MNRPDAFDAAVNESAPTGRDLTLISKAGATASGLPAVVIAFQAQVKGEIVSVQHVVTLREFLNAAVAFSAHHETFDPAWMVADRPRFGLLGDAAAAPTGDDRG